jgi:hypothetical protein
MAKLFDALMMLLCGHRYATPKKALHLIHTNAETRKLFSRHMQLRPNPTTIRIVDALMDLRTADKDKQRPVLPHPMRPHRQHAYRNFLTGIIIPVRSYL